MYDKQYRAGVGRRSLHTSLVVYQARAYPGFHGRGGGGGIEILLVASWMRRWSITRLPPAVNLPEPIYSPGWRKAL